MTVRDLVRSRVWLAALAGGALAAAAAAQAPMLPEPPIAGGLPAAPVPPAVVAPPPAAVTPPAAAIVPPTPPSGAGLPPLVVPVSSLVPKPREVAPAPRPAAVSCSAGACPAGVCDCPGPVVPVVAAPPPPAKPTTPVAPAAPARPKPVTEAARPIPPEPAKLPPAPPADAPKVTGPATTARPAPVVPVTDPAAALDAALLDARSAFARVRDYACHFLRQERVRGKLLPEQTAELYARANPYSVAVKVIAPAGAAGAEAVFVAGRNAGKVRVKPAGAYGPAAWATVEPTDPRVTSEARHSAADVGIGAVIGRVERLVAVERRMRHPVTVGAAEYVFAGRPVTRFEVTCDRPHALRYAHRVVVCVDRETKLPVRFEAYDQPTPAHPSGELLECHSFVNVKLNPGVGDAAFDK